MSISPDWQLPDKLKIPHLEINENGLQHQHLGYEMRKCAKCRCLFVSAIISPFNLCGRKICEEAKT